MENLLLFLLTVSLWFGFFNVSVRKVKTTKEALLRLVTLAVLCAPFNNNGNIYTFMGNVTSEKNIYSVFSNYTVAKGESVSVFSIMSYQEAGELAYSLLGLLNWQESKNSATIVSGMSVQISQERSLAGVGIPFFQKSIKRSRLQFGIAGGQVGKICDTPISFSFYQKEDGLIKMFCIF